MRIVIVGGSKGIGAATKEQLTASGHQVIDVSRSAGTDVTMREDFQARLDDIKDVDALVYCAGHVEVNRIEDVTDDALDYQLEVNLTAAFHALRWFAKRNRHGTVILVASTAALRPSAEWSPYAASKAGLVNLALSANAELAEQGIYVYCVAPGRCATGLRAKLAPDEDPSSIMQPEQVALVIETLLSDKNGTLAGQVIEVKKA